MKTSIFAYDIRTDLGACSTLYLQGSLMTHTDDEDLYPSPLRIALDELLDPPCTNPTREQG